MEIKKCANIQNIDIRMRPVLIAADKIWRNHGQELVVTAGLDGVHSAGSLHYYGLALDFRTRYFDEATRERVAEELKKAFGKTGLFYDVVSHSTHIHVEYDPK